MPSFDHSIIFARQRPTCTSMQYVVPQDYISIYQIAFHHSHPDIFVEITAMTNRQTRKTDRQTERPCYVQTSIATAHIYWCQIVQNKTKKQTGSEILLEFFAGHIAQFFEEDGVDVAVHRQVAFLRLDHSSYRLQVSTNDGHLSTGERLSDQRRFHGPFNPKKVIQKSSFSLMFQHI